MGKFRFNDHISANVANPAKMAGNEGYPAANTLLKSAKVEGKKQDNPTTLANISNTLAGQDPFEINNLSSISNISRGQSVKPEKTYQEQNDELWQKAQNLADWIDDSSSSVPWQERAHQVPELQEMSQEIGRLEKLLQAESVPIDKPSEVEARANMRQQSGFLKDFSPLPRTTPGKLYTLETCPARCKQSGLCYGRAFFDGKPGKNRECTQEQCPWSDQLENLPR